VDQNLVGFAFTAGLVAALNPCGFVMLPAYLALVVRGDGSTSQLVAVGRALGATTAMAVGFLAVFSTFGLLAVSVASTVQRYVPIATVLVGIILLALGLWLLAGRKLATLNPLARSHGWEPTTRIGSMFGYGVGYGMASLSCTIGPFLAVTGATFHGGAVLGGLWAYLAYGAGITLIVGVLAVAVAFTRSALIDRMRRIVPNVNRISGVLLVLVGLYVGYYGVYEVRLFDANGSPSDPVIAAAGRVQGTAAGWVHQHGAGPWVLGVVVPIGLATMATLRSKLARRRAVAAALLKYQQPSPPPISPA
jgi:cytochrome c biogenesis protein CcdA